MSTVDGRCCANGVTDAVGKCCPSGSLDSFGVCDGLDSTGIQRVGLGVALPDNVTLANLTDAASAVRVALDGSIVNHTARRLGRDARFVNVTGYTASGSRRLSAADVWLGRQLTTDTAVATVALLPYGGSNNLPSTTLSTLLVGSGDGVTVASLDSVAVVAVCGNGVCETGERPDAANGVQGCPADCPYPVGDCPEVNGVVRPTAVWLCGCGCVVVCAGAGRIVAVLLVVVLLVCVCLCVCVCVCVCVFNVPLERGGECLCLGD